MKFYEIPDKCSVCGASLVDMDYSPEGLMFIGRMDFEYAVCPACKEISNVMCAHCREGIFKELFLEYGSIIYCEYCGEPISMDDMKAAYLFGLQCFKHMHDDDGHIRKGNKCMHNGGKCVPNEGKCVSNDEKHVPNDEK